MHTYLLTAVGVIFLSVIISLIIPEGKLNKTITFVMRLACIFVLIQPLSTVFSVPAGQTEVLVDYDFVAREYSDGQSAALKCVIAEKFGVEADCTVNVTYSDGKFRAEEVCVVLGGDSGDFVESIYEYLAGEGYINITVYASDS